MSPEEKTVKLWETLDTAADLAEELGREELASFLRHLDDDSLVNRLHSVHRSTLQQLSAMIAHPACVGFTRDTQDTLVAMLMTVHDTVNIFGNKLANWYKAPPKQLTKDQLLVGMSHVYESLVRALQMVK